jgi:hypothetical protein
VDEQGDRYTAKRMVRRSIHRLVNSRRLKRWINTLVSG